MKRIILIAAALVGVLSAYSEELLENGSFEEYTLSSFMSLKSAAFDGWSFTNAWGQNVDSADVVDGKAAFMTTSELKVLGATLYQSIDCSNYMVNDSFRVAFYYKNVNDSLLSLDCYWTASAGSDPLVQEPALQQVLPYSAEWTKVEVGTIKPEGARNFEFRIAFTKKSLAKLDSCSFEFIEPTAPYFTIIPNKDSYSVTAQIKTDTLVAKIAIRQFNLTEPVTLTITGTGKKAFSIDKPEVTATLDTVTVRFEASTVGKYSATLNINDDESPETSIMNRSVSLSATAIDTTKAPIITITPLEFDTFRCKAYESVTDTFIVHSENCYDYVHVVVDDETGDPWAFGLSDSYFLKNETDTVIITFAPKKDGVYTARYKAYTSGIADTIFFSTAGVASEGKPEPIIVDWDTTFVFNTNNPYAIMDENFDHADTCRNKTLKTTDWQNVVTKGQRPWWGYYSDTTTQAKAVSYFSYQDSGKIEMETWLVTPALDYKNAPTKIFSFSVMSDLIYKGQTGRLQLYFVDPSDPNLIIFQHIAAADSLFPADDSELEGNWVPIVMDLSVVPNMPDVFFMVFRFYDKGGNNGVVYYLTDIRWGVGVTAVDEVAAPKEGLFKRIENGRVVIYNNGQRYDILGTRID